MFVLNQISVKSGSILFGNHLATCVTKGMRADRRWNSTCLEIILMHISF